MAPKILIFIMAVIGAALDGVFGFIAWGGITTIALLIVGWLLRRIYPTPRVTLVDPQNQTYTIKNGVQIQPYFRDGDFLTFRCFHNGEKTVLTINLDKGLYSLSGTVGTGNPGPIVEFEPYQSNEVVSAIADYFSDKTDVWLERS